MSKEVERPRAVALPARKWGFAASAALIVPFVLLAGFISAHLHYTLPTPQLEQYLPDGTPVFSEKAAFSYVSDLSTHADGTPKYRIVGTHEMVETDEYILAAVKRIREDVVLNGEEGLHQIEIWYQVGSGTHLFDFMGKRVWKAYTNITNVIVRLSDGTDTSKANAVLVNAHSDR